MAIRSSLGASRAQIARHLLPMLLAEASTRTSFVGVNEYQGTPTHGL